PHLCIKTQHGEIKTHYISAGYFFQLKCSADDDSEEPITVTWSRRWNQTLNTTFGLEVRGDVLQFLPAQTYHNGSYVCEIKYPTGSWQIEFLLFVDPGPCPVPAESRSGSQGINQVLFCRQKDVLHLDPAPYIQWFKDCSPVDKQILDHLWLINITESSAGVYTCFINFTLQGRRYTSARSTQLKVNKENTLLNPRVTNPKKDTVTVEPGSSRELVCSAFLGVGEGTESETFMFWTVNEKHVEAIKELTVSKTKIYQHSSWTYGQSTLSISEVRPEFLHVPFRCIAQNSLGEDIGMLFLQPANHSGFYTTVCLCMAFSMVVVGVVMCFLFKVDLVLASRKLRPLVSKKRAPDGKLYDAYVSYLFGDGSSQAETFALQVLPEVLEKQHGYTLFISGRDDLPGEAIQDLTSETMRRSRRLIIILSAQTASRLHPTIHADEQLPLHQSPQYFPNYDQQIGLYDALIQNGLQVILVETDAKMDYISLPESLRYIRRKQGALRWRSGNSIATSPRNGRFWKCLRYHMPPEPGLKPQATP
uniref:Interleukin 1 receptor type 1 n=1 Tax=Esox lucius TaxID=8010 RepID=A0A3P8ZSY3_ESOLU